MGRNHWKWLVTGVVSIALLAGCSQGGQQSQGPSAGEGDPQTLYNNNCASCHGQNMEGSMGPSLKQIGAKYSAKDIEAIIQNGQGQMPAQNQVSDKDRAKLAKWLAKHK
ncbi:hypothetical protein GCM10011571_02210 [Marinithermofilum abyssi]|uniref:Cytochrome c domain-containing protein n=1 Tax=Marinithermofilum abyssi TaxID=1571185 RepID=A0A8J2VBI1_9BACL|nr:cytochrome c [Marinithermofilum abyssi]GGE04708.1 hypothetical protein GCM10011571_02210 [Marinithermofilum abyssi]